MEAKKPLPTEKQAKMAIGFAKYRKFIEQMENEGRKLLCELGVAPSWFSRYKDFVSECCKVSRKYYGKTAFVNAQAKSR